MFSAQFDSEFWVSFVYSRYGGCPASTESKPSLCGSLFALGTEMGLNTEMHSKWTENAQTSPSLGTCRASWWMQMGSYFSFKMNPVSFTHSSVCQASVFVMFICSPSDGETSRALLSHSLPLKYRLICVLCLMLDYCHVAPWTSRDEFWGKRSLTPRLSVQVCCQTSAVS